jgi:hypothetical protein
MPYQLQVLPQLLEQCVVIPLVMGRNGDAVRDVTNNIQFLKQKKISINMFMTKSYQKGTKNSNLD